MGNSKLIVKFEVFKGTFTTWDALLNKAAEFATQIGNDRLINIAHSDDSGRGVIVVWYWGDRG